MQSLVAGFELQSLHVIEWHSWLLYQVYEYDFLKLLCILKIITCHANLRPEPTLLHWSVTGQSEGSARNKIVLKVESRTRTRSRPRTPIWRSVLLLLSPVNVIILIRVNMCVLLFCPTACHECWSRYRGTCSVPRGQLWSRWLPRRWPTTRRQGNVTVWFIITSLVLFYLSKLLFWGFLQFEGDFALFKLMSWQIVSKIVGHTQGFVS